MALTATMYRFRVTLSDVDRAVYENLDFRVARHPSESGRYLVTRTLAYCLSFEEGIAFSKGGARSQRWATLRHGRTEGHRGLPLADRPVRRVTRGRGQAKTEGLS